MVKGIVKQVIVVRPKGQADFEEAVFFLREDAKSISQEALLKQAGAAVAERHPLSFSLPSFFCGLGIGSLVWLICSFV